MAFEVADVFLFDGVLDGPEIGLELGVEVLVGLHNITYGSNNFAHIIKHLQWLLFSAGRYFFGIFMG